MKISEIFEEEPIQWGLRGDPFLWCELKEYFENIEMPETSENLKTLIEKEYQKSTGYPLTYEKSFGIERFRSYGISSGRISPEFWVKKGIPLLVSRHVKP